MIENDVSVNLEREKSLQELLQSVCKRLTQLLAQGKHHTRVRRNGEERGEEEEAWREGEEGNKEFGGSVSVWYLAGWEIIQKCTVGKSL